MISFGKTEYVSQMKEVWHTVFGDSFDYIDRFFDQMYQHENSLVHLEQGRVAAILFIVPYEYASRDKTSRAAYLYALATLPEFRGRKLMSQMVMKANEICRQRGYAFSVLIPASDSLFGFYKNLGFETAFYKTRIEKSRDELAMHTSQLVYAADFHAQNIWDNPDTSEVYECYRGKKAFYGEGIVLSQLQNQFYIQELKKEGGEVLLLSAGQNHKRYLFLTLEKEVIHIWETNITTEERNYLFQLLLGKYHFSTAVFYQPDYFSKEESQVERSAFAMIHKLSVINLDTPFINRVCM